MIRPIVLFTLAVSATALAACGGATSTTTSQPEPTTAAVTETSATQTADKAGAKLTCTPVSQPTPKGPQSLPVPTLTLDPAKVWTAEVKTNCGDFTITLAAKLAPKTSASFASLSQKGFYDGLIFHRIVDGFVAQGGDPLGSGQGGPGYSVVEAPAADQTYTRGVVAMAKTSAEAPGTSGSQFLIVTAADAVLPPEYALAGQVTKGQEVVDLIGSVPTDPNTESPLSAVVIEKVTIKSS